MNQWRILVEWLAAADPLRRTGTRNLPLQLLWRPWRLSPWQVLPREARGMTSSFLAAKLEFFCYLHILQIAFLDFKHLFSRLLQF